MSKHIHTPNLEWGSKSRKREDAQRGLNATDRRMAIAEQTAENEVCPTCGRRTNMWCSDSFHRRPIPAG